MVPQKLIFTTPVGRLVLGNLYEPRTTGFKGNPLVHTTGPDIGKPRSEYFIGVAFPKERDPATGQVKPWSHTPWGQIIWRAGHAYMATAGEMDFAWKVQDGDKPYVDQQTGRQLPIREGCAGHWILRLSSGFASKIYTCVGVPDPRNPAPLLDKGAVNLGDYIQVNGDVAGNGATGQQAGVYVNHHLVCLAGYGERIVHGPDVASAGFGGQPLPPGASMTPVAGFQQPGVPGLTTQAPMAPPSYAAPGMPTPGVPGQAPGYPPAGSVTPPPQTTPWQPPVQPNYSYMQPPGVPIPGAQPPQGPPAYASPPPMPPQSAPPAPIRQMTTAAMGLPYEAWRQQGWSDEQLIATGRMLP